MAISWMSTLRRLHGQLVEIRLCVHQHLRSSVYYPNCTCYRYITACDVPMPFVCDDVLTIHHDIYYIHDIHHDIYYISYVTCHDICYISHDIILLAHATYYIIIYV